MAADALAPTTSTQASPPAKVRPDQLVLVTVTHNSAREIDALLGSVARHLPGVRTIVVDCASEDPSVETARRCSSAQVIALEENVGFGRGCNRGLLEADAPITVLVNPDVELLDDSLLGLAGEALRPDRRERLLAPLVVSTDGTRQDTVHPDPSSAADVVRAVIPAACLPGQLGIWLAPWRSCDSRRVGWAVGCALASRTDTLRRLGPFDETIFMYSEDMELGLRAAQEGVETWFWPAAKVMHHSAHSTQHAFGDELLVRQAQARRDVVRRRLGRGRVLLDDLAQGTTFASRLVLKKMLRRPLARESGQLRALRSVRRGADGPRHD